MSIIKNTNEIHKSRLTGSDKIALFITKIVGTMPFFYACVALTTIPLFLPSTLPFIHYISSGYLQLILLPLILVSQNLQSKHAELRAEHEYETGLKAEKEIETILSRLDTIEKLLKK
ncbi:MAG TPA: DUF1003 domain-containing protein [Alphaproteobacteria bacterium]|jgi:uncharacterized membrane protein|nr:DUF1003 domain-containing protein [Alphaproteobacteria bacterium]